MRPTLNPTPFEGWLGIFVNPDHSRSVSAVLATPNRTTRRDSMETKEQEPAAPCSEGPAWRAVLESRWDALRRQALGLDPNVQRKLSELSRECQALAAIAALYEACGNITRAAERLGTSRRVLRERIAKWMENNPQVLLPQLAPKAKSRVCEGEEQARRIEGEGP